MDKKTLEDRTKQFALAVIKFVSALPKNKINDVMSYQLLRSGTSIGANYREANRAQSHSDFIHKISLVEKEAAESQYWLELFEELNSCDSEDRNWLLNECNQLIAIFVSIGKTAKNNRTSNKIGESVSEYLA